MGQLKASGKEVVHEDKGNIVVINTCGFINNAKEESINTILEYIQKKEEGLCEAGGDEGAVGGRISAGGIVRGKIGRRFGAVC